MKKHLIKIAKEIRSIYRYGIVEYSEIRRISKISRYKLFSTRLLNNKVFSFDSKSFLGQYTEIFKRNIYSFNTSDNEPYIIDCGANIGLSTIFFKLRFPDAVIIAFEPDQFLCQLFSNNINSFHFNNITLINKGVSDTDGTLKFVGNSDDSGRICIDNESFDNYKEIKVVRLKRYLKKKVHFLKIDIEGEEYRVLNDIRNLLDKVERIFIEFHSYVNRAQELGNVLNILKTNGFRFYIENISIKSEKPFIYIDSRENLDNILHIYGYRPYEKK